MPCTQDFGDGPGLCDAAAGRKRSVTVENFAERAEAARINLAAERLEKTQSRFAVVVDAIVRESERPEQPAPDGALMISDVAIASAAPLMACITCLAMRHTTQSSP